MKNPGDLPFLQGKGELASMLNNLALKFRLFAFPIRIELSFLLICLFLATSSGQELNAYPEIFFWVLISIMIHEFGHAMIGKVFGRNSQIRLYFFGGLTIWSDEPSAELSNFKNILVVAAGPAFGAMFGTLIFILYSFTGFVPHYFLPSDDALNYILFINWGWSILNLLPIFPLDGGQILYYSLRYIKKINAAKVASWIAIGIAGALAALALYAEQLYLAFMLGFLIFQNYQRLNQQSDENLDPKVEHIKSLFAGNRLEEAMLALDEFLSVAKSEAYKAWAVQMMGQVYLHRKDEHGLRGFALKYPFYHKYFPEGKYALLNADNEHTQAREFVKQTFPFHASEGLAIPFFKTLVEEKDFRRVIDEFKRLSGKPWQYELGKRVKEMLNQAGATEESARMGELIEKAKT